MASVLQKQRLNFYLGVECVGVQVFFLRSWREKPSHGTLQIGLGVGGILISMLDECSEALDKGPDDKARHLPLLGWQRWTRA